MNKLYFGDNLEILREIPDERVHLICPDPPFNSGRDYNTSLGDSLAQKKAFTGEKENFIKLTPVKHATIIIVLMLLSLTGCGAVLRSVCRQPQRRGAG